VARLPQLEKRVTTALSKSELAQVESLNSRVEECQANYESAQKDAQALKQQINEIEGKISSAGGSELNKQKAKVDKLINTLSETRQQIARLPITNAALEKAIKKKLRKQLRTILNN